jgi:ferric-dicitrate binding protein FerR (iron transport regulator)
VNAPSRPRGARLWRRLADAQDAALLAAERQAVPPAVQAVPAAANDGARPFPPPHARPAWANTRGGRRRSAAVGLGAAGVLAAAVVVALLARPATLQFHVAADGRKDDARAGGARGAAGRTLVADARRDLPLEFSDGSTITFRGGSAGRVERLTEHGAVIVLDQGHLEAHVVHAARTRWSVQAGPFGVRVTGTRFVVGWNDGKLDLALAEGSVVVDGALLGAGVPLRAGQHLAIEAGVVRIDALSPAAPPAAAPAPATATAATAPAAPPASPAMAPAPAGAPAVAPPAMAPPAPGTRPRAAPAAAPAVAAPAITSDLPPAHAPAAPARARGAVGAGGGRRGRGRVAGAGGAGRVP